MSAEIVNYGGKNIASLQVTTGLYPSTADPLDIRERVANPDVLTSNTPVGCRLYTGLRIYIESTKETVTCLGLISGADGSKWNHWKFDRIIDQFRDAIDDCRNIVHQGRYDLVEPGVYTPQNLLNYLFLRCNDQIVVTHTLTITYKYAGTGSMAAPTYVSQIPEGGTYNVSSPILSGYQSSQDSVTGTMGNEDVTVEVTYSVLSYILTYKRLQSDTEPYAEYSINYNTVVTVPTAPTREHYTFSHWNYSPNLLSGNKMPASDVIAVAAWTYNPDEFVVNATAAPSGSGTISGTGTYTEGSEVTLNATPSGNYSFVNWTEDGNTLGTNPTLILSNLNADHNIVANFLASQATVSVGSQTTPATETGGSVSGGGTFNIGTTITVTATANAGYKFQGWYSGNNKVSNNPNYTLTVTSNLSLVARFIQIVTVTVAVSPNNSGTATGTGEYDYGTSVPLSATPATGYQFAKWVVGSEDYTDTSITITATSDVTAIAYFEAIPVRRVFAWTSPTVVSSADLSSIDLANYTNNSVEVLDTEDKEAYYVNVPQSHSAQDTDTSTYLITAIPNHFEHGTPNGMSGTYFRAEGVNDGVSNMPDLYNQMVQYNGIDYLVVETRALDTSPDGSNYPILFGKVSGNSWAAAVAGAHTINLN